MNEIQEYFQLLILGELEIEEKKIELSSFQFFEPYSFYQMFKINENTINPEYLFKFLDNQINIRYCRKLAEQFQKGGFQTFYQFILPKTNTYLQQLTAFRQNQKLLTQSKLLFIELLKVMVEKYIQIKQKLSFIKNFNLKEIFNYYSGSSFFITSLNIKEKQQKIQPQLTDQEIEVLFKIANNHELTQQNFSQLFNLENLFLFDCDDLNKFNEGFRYTFQDDQNEQQSNLQTEQSKPKQSFKTTSYNIFNLNQRIKQNLHPFQNNLNSSYIQKSKTSRTFDKHFLKGQENNKSQSNLFDVKIRFLETKKLTEFDQLDVHLSKSISPYSKLYKGMKTTIDTIQRFENPAIRKASIYPKDSYKVMFAEFLICLMIMNKNLEQLKETCIKFSDYRIENLIAYLCGRKKILNKQDFIEVLKSILKKFLQIKIQRWSIPMNKLIYCLNYLIQLVQAFSQDIPTYVGFYCRVWIM